MQTNSLHIVALIVVCASLSFAQTKSVSDASAVSVVDNSGATTTRPVQSGSSDPATCTAGKDMFINTTATPTLKLCAATNVWGTIGGGAAGIPFPALSLASNILTLGANCTISVPCVIFTGSVARLITSSSTVSSPVGSGLIYVYMGNSGTLKAGYPAGITSLTCGGTITCETPHSSFPSGSAPLWTWNVTSNTFDSTGTIQQAAATGTQALVAGTNVSLTDLGYQVTINASGGGGATSGIQQFDMTKTSATVATLCSTCSSSTPGIIPNNGILAAAITASATATISGTSASGTIFFYLANGNIPTIAHNTAATITGSAGWTVATGVAAIPRDAVATFWAITFTSNVIDTIVPATMDKRGIQNLTIDGNGIASTIDATTGNITRSTDPNTVPRYSKQAGVPSGTCTEGRDWNADQTGHNFYGCSPVNTWVQLNGGSSTTVTNSFFIIPSDTFGTVNSQGQALGVIYCYDKTIELPTQFSNAYSYITAAVAADIYGVALYSATGARLTGATQAGTTTASTGVVISAFSGAPVTFTPGTSDRVAVCYTSNAGTGLGFSATGPNPSMEFLQPAGDPIVYTAANPASFGGGNITWPATLGGKVAYSTGGTFAITLVK